MASSPATATRNGDGDVPSWKSLLRIEILGPLLLLVLQVSILSPRVEFTSGAMTYLAHPLSVNLILLAIVLFLILTADSLQSVGKWNWSGQRLFWLVVNLVSFSLLFQLTLWMQNEGPDGLSSATHVGWILLILATGITAWLAFVPLDVLCHWIGDHWEKAAGSLILAFGLVLLTPNLRHGWHTIHRPIERMTAALLQVTGSENTYRVSRRSGNPIIGAEDGVTLEVTPHCSEMESVAAYLMISGVILVAFWPRIRHTRFAIFVIGGLIVISCLMAVRLFLLIDIGSRFDNAALSVQLAHSRLSHIFFLAASLIILFGTRRWWYTTEARGQPTLQTDAN